MFGTECARDAIWIGFAVLKVVRRWTYVPIIVNYTGCSKCLWTWRLQYKIRYTDTFWSPRILYSSIRPYYCKIYRMLKQSVNLTITVQKWGSQIIFDHPVYYIHQYVHIIAKYTGCSKSLCTWRLQYKNEVHRHFLITLYIIFINLGCKFLELTVDEMLYEPCPVKHVCLAAGVCKRLGDPKCQPECYLETVSNYGSCLPAQSKYGSRLWTFPFRL